MSPTAIESVKDFLSDPQRWLRDGSAERINEHGELIQACLFGALEYFLRHQNVEKWRETETKIRYYIQNKYNWFGSEFDWNDKIATHAELMKLCDEIPELSTPTPTPAES